VTFWADFCFLQDRADFWRTDLFWRGGRRCVIVFLDLRFVLEKWRMQGDLVFRAASFGVNPSRVDFDAVQT